MITIVPSLLVVPSDKGNANSGKPGWKSVIRGLANLVPEPGFTSSESGTTTS